MNQHITAHIAYEGDIDAGFAPKKICNCRDTKDQLLVLEKGILRELSVPNYHYSSNNAIQRWAQYGVWKFPY